MEQFLITLSIILAYASIFLFVGLPIIKKLLLKKSNDFNHFYFLFGAAFFIGTIIFLFVWSVLAHTSKNVVGSLYITTGLAIVWIFAQRHNLLFLQFSLKRRIIIGGLISITLALGILHSLVPMPRYFVTNPERTHSGAGFRGVAHSFRAGNLTNFIVKDNYFPRVNQNSGQSILAAIPAFYGHHAPQLALVIWLQIYISVLAILLYGLARCFIHRPGLALIPTLVVMLGNPALSPFFWNISDTGNISLLVYNVDSVISTVSLLLLFILLYLHQDNLRSKWLLLAVAVGGFTWNVVGGHATPLFGVALLFIFLVFWRRQGMIKIIPLTITFLFGSIVGIVVVGGLLLPTKYADPVNIPGMVVVKTKNVPALTLRFPRTLGNPPLIFSAFAELRKLKQSRPSTIGAGGEQNIMNAPITGQNIFVKIIQRIKGNRILFALVGWVRSLQLIFFPLLGIGLTAIFLYKRKKTELAKHGFLVYFFPIACFLFAVGWIISTFFALYGNVFPLSRFICFGVFVTMFLLGLILALILQQTQRRLTQTVVSLVFCFIIIGALIDYFVVGIIENFYLPPPQNPVMQTGLPQLDSLPPLSLEERFNLLIRSQATYGAAVPK